MFVIKYQEVFPDAPAGFNENTGEWRTDLTNATKYLTVKEARAGYNEAIRQRPDLFPGYISIGKVWEKTTTTFEWEPSE